MKKAMRRYGSFNDIVTDRPRLYSAAIKELGYAAELVTKRWANNRAENSHLPFRLRERAMLRFRRMHSLQKFVSIQAAFHNHSSSQRSLSKCINFKQNRDVTLAEWRSWVILKKSTIRPLMREPIGLIAPPPSSKSIGQITY